VDDARAGMIEPGEGDPASLHSWAGVAAEEIPPEEINAALRLALAGGEGIPRRELIAATRALLGYARTGPRLEEVIGAAIDGLLRAGEAGEASTGIRLRE
jgi:hypothetical protein